MSKNLDSNNNVKFLGLLAFVVTGLGLIASTLINEQSLYRKGIVIIIGVFFLVGVVDHFKKLTERDDKR